MLQEKRRVIRVVSIAGLLTLGLISGGCAWLESSGGEVTPGGASAVASEAAPSRSVAREAAAVSSGDMDAEYGVVVDYEYGGDSDEELRALGERIAQAPREERAAIEDNLLAVLADDDLTPAGRYFAFSMLRLVASNRSAPHLEDYLRDPATTDQARYALQSIPSSNVDDMLIRAASALSGRAQISVINALGARRSEAAVEALGRHALSTDPEVAEAAVHALGRIGGREAARTLITADIAPELVAVREDAVLLTADALLEKGDKSAAVDVYKLMLNSDWPYTIVAAARGLALSQGETALPALLELLHFPWPETRQCVPDILNDIPGPTVTRRMSGELPALSPDMRILTLVALIERGDAEAVPGIEGLLGNEDEAVEMMALTALSQLGEASSVPVIAEAMGRGGLTRLAALSALENIGGAAQVDIALRQALMDAPDADVADLIAMLARRGCRLVTPILFDIAAGEHIAFFRAAIEALGELAGPENAATMVEMLIHVPEDERDLAESATTALARRLADGRVLSEAIQEALPQAPESARPSLIRVLGATRHSDALPTLRRYLDDTAPGVSEAAARVVIDWPDAEALQDVLRLAESSSSATLRVLAVRGGMRMLEAADDMPDSEALRWSRSFYQAAPRAEEKALVISGMARIETADTLEFLLDLVDDPDVGPQALVALQRLYESMGAEAEGERTREAREAQALDRARDAMARHLGTEVELARAGWMAVASHRADQAGAAIDGDMETRWDTGTTMRPDMWYQIDLGESARVARLVIDTSPSGNDYPREYAIYVTDDREDWGAPVATGQGDGAVMDITLAPKTGRHVRIAQGGESDSSYWSIHELRLFVLE